MNLSGQVKKMRTFYLLQTINSSTCPNELLTHPFEYYSHVIMGATASQITTVSSVYSTVCSGADKRKHQSSASLATVRGIHPSPVNSPHKRPVTRKLFPFDDVIMEPKINLYDCYLVEVHTFFLPCPLLAFIQWSWNYKTSWGEDSTDNLRFQVPTFRPLEHSLFHCCNVIWISHWR